MPRRATDTTDTTDTPDDHDARIRRLHEDGCDVMEIACRLSKSRDLVRQRLAALGLADPAVAEEEPRRGR